MATCNGFARFQSKMVAVVAPGGPTPAVQKSENETPGATELTDELQASQSAEDLVAQVESLVVNRSDVIRILLQRWRDYDSVFLIDGVEELSVISESDINELNAQLETPEMPKSPPGLVKSPRGRVPAASGECDATPATAQRQEIQRKKHRIASQSRWKRLQHRAEAQVRISRSVSLAVLALYGIVLTSTMFSSYWLAKDTKRVSKEDFFISSAIDHGLPHRLGALGVDISVVLLLILSCIRFVAVCVLAEPLPEVVSSRILRINRCAFVAIVVASFAGFGVGAFNVSFNMMYHLVFAFLTGAGLISACCLNSWIDYILSRHPGMHGGIWSSPALSRNWLRYRIFLNVVSGMSLIGFTYYFDTGSHQRAAAACELLLASSVALYFASWSAAPGTGYAIAIDVTGVHQCRVPGAPDIHKKLIMDLRRLVSPSTPSSARNEKKLTIPDDGVVV